MKVIKSFFLAFLYCSSVSLSGEDLVIEENYSAESAEKLELRIKRMQEEKENLLPENLEDLSTDSLINRCVFADHFSDVAQEFEELQRRNSKEVQSGIS